MSPVILTTSGSLPNNQDYEIAELVTAECVMGMNAVSYTHLRAHET